MSGSDALVILQASVDECAEVLALAEALFAEVEHRSEGDPPATTRHLLSDAPDFVALLAWRQSQAVGLLTLSPAVAIYVGGAFGLIHEFYVRPEVRSSGIGRMLLHEAERIGKRRGWLRLEVTAAPRAVDFYLNNGFEGTGPHLKRLLGPVEPDHLTSTRPV